MRFSGFGGKFGDNFVENGVTVLVAVDFDEKAERFVVLENW